MNEQWRDIPGWEGWYQVSSHGNVRSLPRVMVRKDRRLCMARGRQLALINKGPYKRVNLYRIGAYESPLVHSLVARAFLPNPECKPQVNHINGVQWDNRVDNLEWATSSENMSHASRCGLLGTVGESSHFAKLSAAQVVEIRAQFAGGISQRAIARDFGISQSQVSRIASGRDWKSLI